MRLECTKKQSNKKEKTKKTSEGRPDGLSHCFVKEHFNRDEQKVARFKQDFITKPVKGGKFVDFDNLRTQGFLDMKPLFDYFGWSEYVSLKTKYYPQLVRVFYCNADYIGSEDGQDRWIESYVKGMHIKLDAPLLEKLFNLPSNGLC